MLAMTLFIFGLTAEEVEARSLKGDDPREAIEASADCVACSIPWPPAYFRLTNQIATGRLSSRLQWRLVHGGGGLDAYAEPSAWRPISGAIPRGVDGKDYSKYRQPWAGSPPTAPSGNMPETSDGSRNLGIVGPCLRPGGEERCRIAAIVDGRHGDLTRCWAAQAGPRLDRPGHVPGAETLAAATLDGKPWAARKAPRCGVFRGKLALKQRQTLRSGGNGVAAGISSMPIYWDRYWGRSTITISPKARICGSMTGLEPI